MGPKTSSKFMSIDADQAAHFRKTCHYPGQRKISEGNVKRLMLPMENGQFIQGTSIHFCALPDGTLYLVNGNHCMEAVMACGVPQVFNVVVLDVPDMDAVDDIYMNFDTQKPRSWQDALRAKKLDQEIPLSSFVMPAIGLIQQGFKYSSDNVEANTDRAKRFALMNEYRAAAGQIHDAIAGAPNLHRRLCLRRAVLGVMLETFKYQAPVAAEFWHALAFDDGLRIGDPRKTLLRYLLENKITGPIENFRQSRACALAWNAYYKNESLTMLKPGAGHPKLVLLGTPWGTTKRTQTMPPAPRPEITPEVPEQQDARDLFETGMQTGPDGAKPITFYKH